ncbi:MAG: hypothetical protein ACLQIQ_14170 [Beijerinckiaceae bacterium]
MTANLKKMLAGGLAALTLGIGVSVTSTPAAAQGGFGLALGAGLLGGAAIGALATRPYYYPPPYYYGPGPAYYPGPGCYWQNRPALDGYGNVVGYRRVRVCY